MVNLPDRILLDTNIFILGSVNSDSAEGRILLFLAQQSGVTLLLSNDLIAEIRQVARRISHKDWAGYLLNRIWTDYRIEYVTISTAEKEELEAIGYVPREDAAIYLTALRGGATCFISANHEFVQQAGSRQSLFESLSPDAFLEKYVAT